MKLSQNQRKEMKEKLKPLFEPYADHSSGWPSLWGERGADHFTGELLALLKEWGVDIFG